MTGRPPLSPELLARLDRGLNIGDLRALATIRRVSRSHGVLPSDVVGVTRRAKVAQARHELCWRLRDLGLTVRDIGGLLNRNHSTVIYGVERYASTLEETKC